MNLTFPVDFHVFFLITKYKQRTDIDIEQTAATGCVMFLAFVEIREGLLDVEIRTGTKAKATAALPRRKTNIRAEW